MTDIHSNKFWRNVITKLKGEDAMTEHDAMKKMESAINELNIAAEAPQVENATVNSVVRESTHIRVAPQQGLDASRLIELARSRLQFARDQLQEIKRDHTLKAFEIDNQYQQRLTEAAREHDEAHKVLAEQTNAKARPAMDMIDLVEKMLK